MLMYRRRRSLALDQGRATTLSDSFQLLTSECRLYQDKGRDYTDSMARFYSGFNKANELRKLHKKEIEAYLGDPHKKAADLRSAYELAKDPEDWNEEQNQIVRRAEAAGEDDEEEEDMLADDDDVKPAKKRKQPSTNLSNKKVKLSGASSVKKASNSVARKSEGGKSEDPEEGEQRECKGRMYSDGELISCSSIRCSRPGNEEGKRLATFATARLPRQRRKDSSQ